MSGATVAALSPEEIVRRLSALYGAPEWRPHGDPLTELVLTILSQNTSDANSGRAFMRLRARFPTWESLLSADPADIEEAIRIGGLSQVKAVRIKALLGEVVAQRGSLDLSFLREMPPDRARAWLEALPGVGPKTAACVLLFSLGLPALPVDTHVHRVALRLGLVPPRTPPAKAQALLEEWVPPELHYQFHVLLIRHGRRLCRAQRPLCPRCPLLDACPYGQASRTS
ncbi:MAG TPA: endonuclease III [Dehalococcoidia bacterium]|nr:endonuclease III [Dehalococcoidia bacterium]